MATITEKGKLYIKGEVKTGTTKNGNPWANQQIVVEVYGFNNSIKRVALTTNRVDNLNTIQDLPLGTEVEIQYSVSAREWNNKWYADVDLISIKSLAQSMQTATRPTPTPTPAPAPAPMQYKSEELDPQKNPDDLPF